jgi:hypothetical protein
MKKLKLNLDQVQVVSFAVEAEGRSGGTVNGFAPDTQVGCGGGSNPLDSCESCFPHDCPREPISWNTTC